MVVVLAHLAVVGDEPGLAQGLLVEVDDRLIGLLDGHAGYVARAGMRLGFTTIAASGENAVMLHYSDNSCTVRPGDLILFDLGAEYGYSAGAEHF